MNTPHKGKQEIMQLMLELIQRYANGQFDSCIELCGADSETEKVIVALNALGEGLRRKNEFFNRNKKRIDEILDVLMTFTMSDFGRRINISDEGDELDAIALGLNTLAEELDAAKAQEQKHIRELEAANKELKSFTYLASHDLKEPLRNLRMFSSLVVETEAQNLSEKGKVLFDKIVGAAARLENLIEDLGAFSRIQSINEELKPVDLNAVIKEIEIVQTSLPQQQDILLEVGQLPTINGMPGQIRQLFGHIVGNSIKYSKPNLPLVIKISAAIMNGKDIAVENADVGKDYIKITIADNGIGFDGKYAEKIFEIFQRLHTREKYAGTGIGLALCRKIVQNHGGFIYATGEEGKGASFFVYLPV